MIPLLLASVQLLAAAADGHARFLHGVASGDPLQDAVIIWTRYTPDESTQCCPSVTWYIAKNLATVADGDKAGLFSDPMQTGTVSATGHRDFTVKVDVTGLEPGTDYVYAFSSGSAVSPVGTTKTAPSGPVAELTYAFVSCAHYTFGFFHAYDVASTLTDLDFWVHLGDYIYESGDYGYSGDVRSHWSPDEAVSLEDYRMRYSQYNMDEAVQNLRRRAPMIAVWDDHEVSNDNFDTGAENHQPTCSANRNSTDAEKAAAKCDQDEGSYTTRAQVAVQAWLEWMPIREQPGQFGEFDFNVTQAIEWGDLLTIVGLDTRLSARTEPGSDIFESLLAGLAVQNANVTAWKEEPLKSQFEAAAALLNSASEDPERVMIGQEQLNLLESVFQRSKDAGKPWQVFASASMMGPLRTPNFDLLPDAVRLIDPALQPSMRLFIEGLLASTDPSPFPPLTIGQVARVFTAIGMFNARGSKDDWEGYANKRRLLLEMFNSSCSNAIAIGGDLHDSYLWTMREDAQPTGEPVAVNVGTPSVSSPGNGVSFYPIFISYVGLLLSQQLRVTSQLAWDLMHLALQSTMPDLQFVNLKDKGFVAAKVSHTEHVVNFILVNDGPSAADHEAILRTDYASARGDGLTASSYCAGSYATTAGQKGSLTSRGTSCNVQFDTARPGVWSAVQVPTSDGPASMSTTAAPMAAETEGYSASSSAAAQASTTGPELSWSFITNGKCKGLLDSVRAVSSMRGCAIECVKHASCRFFSYSGSKEQCLLHADCDSVGGRWPGSVYHLYGTGAPSAAPTAAPTPAPTPPVTWSLISSGRCKSRGPRITNVSNIGECASECAKDASFCLFFSHSDTISECRLHAHCAGFGRNWPGSAYELYGTSAPTAAPPSYSLYYSNGRCKGFGLGQASEASVEDCATKCDEKVGCAFFSYAADSQKCRMTSACGNIGRLGPDRAYNVYMMD